MRNFCRCGERRRHIRPWGTTVVERRPFDRPSDRARVLFDDVGTVWASLGKLGDRAACAPERRATAANGQNVIGPGRPTIAARWARADEAVVPPARFELAPLPPEGS